MASRVRSTLLVRLANEPRLAASSLLRADGGQIVNLHPLLLPRCQFDLQRMRALRAGDLQANHVSGTLRSQHHANFLLGRLAI